MNWLSKSKLQEQQFVNDLRGLISIESTENLSEAAPNAPFGKEVRRALDYMLNLGCEAGFEVIDYDGYCGAIVYGDAKESIGVLGHLDIVPLGEGWSKDPLGCEQVDGYLFGRGIVDDKGPTMAAFYAMKLLKDANIQPNKKIILIVGCNEETGMVCMDYYEKHGEIPSCGFTPDAEFPLIYGEKGHVNVDLVSQEKTCIIELNAGERPNIVIGNATAKVSKLTQDQKNAFEYYLKVFKLKGSVTDVEETSNLQIEGKYFHAAMSYNGVNAALHLLNFIGETLNDALAKAYYTLLNDWKGTGIGIAKEGAYMGFLTMNVGIVRMQENQSRLTLDIRYPNEMNGADILKNIETSCNKQEVKISLEHGEDSVPLFVDPNTPFIQTLMSSYQKYTNDTFTPAKTIGGGTYARKFKNFVAYGSMFPNSETPSFFVGGPHEKDEGMKLDELIACIAIYCDAIQELSA